MESANKGAAALALLAIAVGCQDFGKGKVAPEDLAQYQIPGENTAWAETSSQGNDLALVSLVFSRVEVTSIQAVDRSTQRAIGFEVENTEDLLVVTLRLTRNQKAEPQLRFLTESGEKSLEVIVTPTHSLETYPVLEMEGPERELIDPGLDSIVLSEGESATVSHKDMVYLWNGSTLALSARARIVNNGEAGLFQLRLKPEGGQGFVTQGAQLLRSTMFTAEHQESTGLMVSPTTCSPVELEVIRAQ